MKPIRTTLMLLISMPIFAAYAETVGNKMIEGSVYVSVRYVNSQITDAQATFYEPGVFEGTETISFDQGAGFGLAGGILREGEYFFGGLEIEWLMHDAYLAEELPSEVFKDANNFKQMNFNLNAVFGATLLRRYLRPYLFGGFGYTEATLDGQYGLANTSRGDESWDSTFGYHVGAGMGLKVYEGFYLDAGYRYYGATDALFGSDAAWIEIPNSGSLVYVGLTYNHLFPPQEKKP